MIAELNRVTIKTRIRAPMSRIFLSERVIHNSFSPLKQRQILLSSWLKYTIETVLPSVPSHKTNKERHNHPNPFTSTTYGQKKCSNAEDFQQTTANDHR